MKTFQSPIKPENLVNQAVFNNTVIDICCPNCGSPAERHFLSADHLIRTQCPTCDYLMITCSQTGRVIEAYAPGIFAR